MVSTTCPVAARARARVSTRVARAFGELWLFPAVDDGSEWITLHEFAALAGRSRETVRWWYKRPPSWGTPPVKVAGRVRRTEVVAFLTARDTADGQRGQDAA